MFLKEEDVLEVQGLDAWMHMQFQWLPGLHLVLVHGVADPAVKTGHPTVRLLG